MKRWNGRTSENILSKCLWLCLMCSYLVAQRPLWIYESPKAEKMKTLLNYEYGVSLYCLKSSWSIHLVKRLLINSRASQKFTISKRSPWTRDSIICPPFQPVHSRAIWCRDISSNYFPILHFVVYVVDWILKRLHYMQETQNTILNGLLPWLWESESQEPRHLSSALARWCVLEPNRKRILRWLPGSTQGLYKSLDSLQSSKILRFKIWLDHVTWDFK